MARKESSFLKLHVEDPSVDGVNESGPVPFDIDSLLTAFANATGWQARNKGQLPHSSNNPEETLPLRKRMSLVATAPIDGVLEPELQESNVIGEQEAWALLEQIDSLVQQLAQSERIIERQETQLATTVGVSIRQDEAEILNSRLNEVLERAAVQTHSDAAAIYLLDDSTSELKMRSCFGMPISKLGETPRPLRGSMADLEALMGNAVLVENVDLAPEWNCPEDFGAGMCLPIGSPTMPHGTIWLWSQHIRDFSTSDVEAAKSACEKILINLERSVLAEEVLTTRAKARAVEDASLVQSARLPNNQPLHSDYDIGGWTFQGQSLGGNFHTWTMNKHMNICAAVGEANQSGPSGALVATSTQTVIETCWNANHRPSQILRKANDILWASEDESWKSSLCYMQVHPQSGSTQLSLCGDIQTFLLGERGFRPVAGTPTQLGEQPDTSFRNEQIYLEGGELLVVVSGAVLGGMEQGGFTQDIFMETLRKLYDENVGDIADQLARMLPIGPSGTEGFSRDRSLMILRRKF